ncbi:MBG domain-containing protein [Chitinophaga tropicalis]|nr:MBG domain-containing protein [Chitinophaga tropicalis]
MKKILLFLLFIGYSLTGIAQRTGLFSYTPSSGPVGTLVTITGFNLSSIVNATIGGTNAIIISKTDTRLVAMIMPGAVTGNLVLTTNTGAVLGGSYFPVTITPTPAPNIQQGNKLVGTGNTGAAYQAYSAAISADGNTAIVGGYADDNGKGAAWVFTRSGETWTQEGSKLVGTGATDASTDLGWSVAISADGNTALVGGIGDGNTGATWVFVRSGGVWTQEGSKLTGTNGIGSQQGVSVSLSADGNTALVGGPTDNNGKGAAWVFVRSGGVWTQQGNKLVGTGNAGDANQGAAVSLSADGNTAILGGTQDNGGIGAAWIFTRSGSTWTQQGNKLVGTGNTGNSEQGTSVALSANGNTAIIGGISDNNSVGAAWVFARSGSSWSQQGSKLAGTDAATGFGWEGRSVSLSADGNTAIVGGSQDNGNEGGVWVYTRSGSTWTQKGNKRVGTGGAGPAAQGNSAALSADGNTFISGGWFDASGTGAAWIFKYASDNANLSALTLSSGTLSPVFDPAIIAYTASVNNTVSSITVTPVREEANATIEVQVNGGGYAAVESGSASGNLALNTGSNTIDIKVTAADGINVKIYTVTVTRLEEQVITFTALANHTYGDPDFMLAVTGGASGNPVTYTSSDMTVATISGNTVTILAAGTTTITASQAGDATYDAAADVTQVLTIDRKNITVTADAKIKNYGDADPVLTYTFSPALVTGDAFTGILDRAAGENVGAYAINQNTLALNSNYILNYTSSDLTIGAKAVTITADAKSKTYGDADPALTYTFTPALITGDAFTGVLSRTTGENAGTYTINQNTLSLNSNYALNYIDADLTIGTKAVTVTADAKSKTYGDADPALTYTFIPALIAGDVFTGTLSRAAGENVGTYAINQNTLALNSNYILNYTSADLTIGTKTVTVTADAQNKTYGDADPTFTYTVTPALVMGDSFTGVLGRTAGENIGTYAIHQNTLALNSNYVLNYTSADLTIAKKTVVVTANAQSKTYGDADPVFTYIVAPALVTGDGFTGALSRTAGESIGTYSINQNSLSLNSNYVLNYASADLTIGKKTVVVTADAQNKIYGDTDPALTYTFAPALITGDAFTGILSRTVGESIGTYSINQNTLSLNSNYVLNYAGADLTIGAKTITVTADTKSKTYGDTDPALTYTFTPALITGDAFTGTLSRTASENVGTYSINQNTLSLGQNYILNYTAADLTIKKKSLTISADDKNKVFGTANPILSATYTGFTGTDNETVLNTPVVLTITADINSPVGTYPIRAGGATSQNYDISFVDGTLTITSSNQHIDFEALEDKLSTDGTFTLTATATSGLPVIYTSSNSAIARIVNGNQVEILHAGTVIITASQDGNVNYTAATPVSQQLTILDNPLPVIVIESNKGSSISKGETVLLTAGGANTYQWLAANGIVSGENTSVLTVRPSVTTTYTVTGSNQYGRSSTQTFTLEVKDDLEATGATNILTPNGDGINDYWIVRNIDMFPNNEVKIFDRSGRLVYTKKGYTNNWGATVNGSPLAEGTYYYIIDFGNGAGIKKGFITIVRR